MFEGIRSFIRRFTTDELEYGRIQNSNTLTPGRIYGDIAIGLACAVGAIAVASLAIGAIAASGGLAIGPLTIMSGATASTLMGAIPAGIALGSPALNVAAATFLGAFSTGASAIAGFLPFGSAIAGAVESSALLGAAGAFFTGTASALVGTAIAIPAAIGGLFGAAIGEHRSAKIRNLQEQATQETVLNMIKGETGKTLQELVRDGALPPHALAHVETTAIRQNAIEQRVPANVSFEPIPELRGPLPAQNVPRYTGSPSTVPTYQSYAHVPSYDLEPQAVVADRSVSSEIVADSAARISNLQHGDVREAKRQAAMGRE